MSKLFDPIAAQNLMDSALEENATRRQALPPGETIAQIMKMGISAGTSGPTSKRPGSPWTRLDFTLEVTDPEYLSIVPETPEKVTTFLGLMVDMQEGQIATGVNKNVRLGQLRAAAGVNGKPLSALIGNFIRITIGVKPHPTEKDEEGNAVYINEITGYTKV